LRKLWAQAHSINRLITGRKRYFYDISKKQVKLSAQSEEAHPAGDNDDLQEAREGNEALLCSVQGKIACNAFAPVAPKERAPPDTTVWGQPLPRMHGQGNNIFAEAKGRLNAGNRG